MSLAFAGAHRTGKSTLAQAFAQELDVPYVKTGTAEVFASLGLDPKAEYPIEQRVAIQSAILEALQAQWRDALSRSVFFVSDRSPLDLAMYLLADVARTSLLGLPAGAQLVTEYVDRCFDVSNRYFSTIILVQPGIPLVEAEGRAPACPAYMEHLNNLVSGLLHDRRLQVRSFRLPKHTLKLEARVRYTHQAISNTLDHHQELVDRGVRSGKLALH